MFTYSFYSPQSSAIQSDDVRFIIADEFEARAVASLAGRHDVLRSIVSPVAVDVIGHDIGAFCAAIAEHRPLDRRGAPVANMWSGADAIIEQFAGFQNVTVFRRKRMIRCPKHPAHTWNLFSRRCHIKEFISHE